VHDTLKILVLPTVAANQSLASDLAGGTNETAVVFVMPAGMSADFSTSLFAPDMPEFHHIEALVAADELPAGHAMSFLIRREEAQGRNTELVTVQMPPNAPTRSCAETDTIEFEPATYLMRAFTTNVLLICGGSETACLAPTPVMLPDGSDDVEVISFVSLSGPLISARFKGSGFGSQCTYPDWMSGPVLLR